jgi:AraC-like DNA-binding protein
VGRAFSRHRHDTYAIGVTDLGVQAFDYRGAVERSTPGQVVILHPDEPHDGRAGTGGAFGYSLVYVDPARMGAAVEALQGRPWLPFVREAVSDDPLLAAAVRAAFTHRREPLARDAVVLRLAEGLLRAGGASPRPCRLDRRALERARDLLEVRRTVVRSAELEAVTGLSRFALARQFRARYGASPYRYSLQRRLEEARARLRAGLSIGAVALATGFADQAHLTRMFRGAFGLTPGRYLRLLRADLGTVEMGGDHGLPDHGPRGA